MWKNIEERMIACGDYIIKTGCTVRICAIALEMSKSSVHAVVIY